jgi:hypothetical protein
VLAAGPRHDVLWILRRLLHPFTEKRSNAPHSTAEVCTNIVVLF